MSCSFYSFRWAVLAKLHPSADQKHANRVSQYRQYASDLLECYEEMPLEKIDAFEVSNNLAINIFTIEGESIVPLRASMLENARDNIDLLLIEKDENRHYCLIKDLQRLTKSGRRKKSLG